MSISEEYLQPTTSVPEHELIKILIDGVEIQCAKVLGDDRGSITELFDRNDPYWSLGMAWMYRVTCRPNKIKGWGIHDDHTDRYMVIEGEAQVILFDDRKSSPSFGVVQEFYLSHTGVNQLTIPPGIWHLHRNLGTTDLIMLNAPSEPYNHSKPDKRKLPIVNDYIPYILKPSNGW
ncbi:MAG: dTDP-4-dehydrorhamnose 3,5-epimerase family protein [Actinomycetes bacterium]